MSAGTKITRLPARRAAVISSRAIAPPPMPTIVRLACTIAVEVGDSADEPGRRPPQVVSRTKNTSSTHFDSATPCFAREHRDDADRREAHAFRELVDRADAFFRRADVDERAARLELATAPPSPARASRRGPGSRRPNSRRRSARRGGGCGRTSAPVSASRRAGWPCRRTHRRAARRPAAPQELQPSSAERSDPCRGGSAHIIRPILAQDAADAWPPPRRDDHDGRGATRVSSAAAHRDARRSQRLSATTATTRWPRCSARNPWRSRYSTVTLFARLRGLSTSVPRAHAVWYASSCSGTTCRIGDSTP